MKKILSTIAAGLFLLAGCGNLPNLEDTEALTAATDEAVTAVQKEQAFLRVSASLADEARTALPSFSTAAIEDFSYTLSYTASGEQTSQTYESLTALTSATIPVAIGENTFVLRATKGGTSFTALKAATIAAGENSIAFELAWDESALSGTGSLSFTLAYPANSGVAAGVGEVFSYNAATGAVGDAVADSQKALEISGTSVTYALDPLAAGVYSIKISLYADEAKTVLLNTWNELAVVTDGFASTASRTATALNPVYTLTFNANDGTLPAGAASSVTYTRFSLSSVTLPTPTKTGYTFGGWYNEEALTTKVETLTAGITTLYAKWEQVPLTITFHDGTSTKTQSFTAGDVTLDALSFDVPSGKKFGGWALTEGGEKAYSNADTVTLSVDTDLYALWVDENAAVTSLITYILNADDADVDNSANPAEYTEGTAVTLVNPTRTGYTFGGWYSDEALTTPMTEIPATATGTQTLYALWSAAKSISVTIAETADLTLTPEKTDTGITITASGAEDGATYSWAVDNTAVEATGATYTLDTSNLADGVYIVTVTAGNRSATATVTVGDGATSAVYVTGTLSGAIGGDATGELAVSLPSGWSVIKTRTTAQTAAYVVVGSKTHALVPTTALAIGDTTFSLKLNVVIPSGVANGDHIKVKFDRNIVSNTGKALDSGSELVADTESAATWVITE